MSKQRLQLIQDIRRSKEIDTKYKKGEKGLLRNIRKLKKQRIQAFCIRMAEETIKKHYNVISDHSIRAKVNINLLKNINLNFKKICLIVLIKYIFCRPM